MHCHNKCSFYLLSFSGNLIVVLLCVEMYEETDLDEDLKAEFLCPFCAEDFDVVGPDREW